MDAALANRIEHHVERASAALFGAAVGYAAYAWLAPMFAQPQLGALTGSAAAMAFVGCDRVLKALGPAKRRYPISILDLRTIELLAFGDSPVTQRDQVPSAGEPLVLDDILAGIAPDARVVRLFDPATMPTPAQLRARIDRHLDNGAPRGESPDASRALHEALAELRRSLR